MQLIASLPASAINSASMRSSAAACVAAAAWPRSVRPTGFPAVRLVRRALQTTAQHQGIHKLPAACFDTPSSLTSWPNGTPPVPMASPPMT